MGHEYKYMGHETANWGGRGLGYMLFNTHLCNQPYYCKVVVGPGAQICTLLEVWVLRVGMSTLGRKRLCTPRIGDPQVPMTLERGWNRENDVPLRHGGIKQFIFIFWYKFYVRHGLNPSLYPLFLHALTVLGKKKMYQ